MKNPWLILSCLMIFGLLTWFSYRPLWQSPAENFQVAVSPVGQGPLRQEATAQRTLKICSDIWMPYAGVAGSAYEGYFIDILRQIYEPLGYRLDYYTIPWTRCIQDVRDGTADGLVTASFSQKQDLIFPESSLGLDQTAFFTKADSSWNFTNQADLGRIKLGAVQDYDYLEWLNRYIRLNGGTDKVWFARGDYPLERLITALQDGKIDTFVENSEVVNAYLKQHRGRVRLRSAGSAGQANRLYAAFSPKKADAEKLARLLDRKIDDLRASGQLQVILDRYGMSDWRQQQPASPERGDSR